MPTGQSDLADVLTAFEIVAVPTSTRCKPNETHALGTIEAIDRNHGTDHLRLVLQCLTADPANRSELWSETIGSISDVIRFRCTACPQRLVAAFAGIDVRRHRNRAVRLRPWPVRATLRTFIDADLEERIPNV